MRPPFRVLLSLSKQDDTRCNRNTMAESVGAEEESNLVLSAPGGVCEYEREREERIQRNRELMAELGITQSAAKLQQVLNKPASKRPPSKPSRSVLSLEKEIDASAYSRGWSEI
jgi:hypothetical protein